MKLLVDTVFLAFGNADAGSNALSDEFSIALLERSNSAPRQGRLRPKRGASTGSPGRHGAGR